MRRYNLAVSTVVIDVHVLVDLLVIAGITDPQRWPEEARAGAALLARIRQIEADCKAQHGQWDWELLSPELQNEYDVACGKLDRLRYPEESGISLEELKRKNPQYA